MRFHVILKENRFLEKGVDIYDGNWQQPFLAFVETAVICNCTYVQENCTKISLLLEELNQWRIRYEEETCRNSIEINQSVSMINNSLFV